MRLTILNLARHVAQLKSCMRDADHEEVCDLLWKLSLLSGWQWRHGSHPSVSSSTLPASLTTPKPKQRLHLPSPGATKTTVSFSQPQGIESGGSPPQSTQPGKASPSWTTASALAVAISSGWHHPPSG